MVRDCDWRSNQLKLLSCYIKQTNFRYHTVNSACFQWNDNQCLWPNSRSCWKNRKTFRFILWSDWFKPCPSINIPDIDSWSLDVNMQKLHADCNVCCRKLCTGLFPWFIVWASLTVIMLAMQRNFYKPQQLDSTARDWWGSFRYIASCVRSLETHSLTTVIVVLEQFLNECPKTKTKAIRLTNHNRRKQHNEPIKYEIVKCD